jgi:hypothetical protein
MVASETLYRQSRINPILIAAVIVSIGHHGYNPQHRCCYRLLTDFCTGFMPMAQTFLARIAEHLIPEQDVRRSSCAAQAKNDK